MVRNFSISHDHICISKLRYQRQMDGSNLDGASKAGFANCLIASLFNQVYILGGKLISSATNIYAHRSTYLRNVAQL